MYYPNGSYLLKHITFFSLIILLQILFLSTNIIFSLPYHTIFVDGIFTDWSENEIYAEDRNDSRWSPGTGKDEIERLYLTWDKNNLYIGILGRTQYGLLMYIDIDTRDKNSGVKDLLYVSVWNRKVVFQNFYPEFFYGSWNGSNGNFYRIESSIHVVDVSGYTRLVTNKELGTELSLPWNLLYSLGEGKVIPGAEIGIFVSLATGDMGSETYQEKQINYGYLGGDCIPNESNDIFRMTVSTITNFIVINIDRDNDGVPDNKLPEKEFSITKHRISKKIFSPYDLQEKTEFELELSQPANVSLKIYDLKGNLVRIINENIYAEKIISYWDGKKNDGTLVSPGIYILNFSAEFGPGKRIRKNFSISVIK